jgi:hypothetical protein
MNSIWLKPHERIIDVRFQMHDDFNTDGAADSETYCWDVAKPTVDAVVHAMTDQRVQVLDHPHHSLNTNMEVWAFQILFRGWTSEVQVGWLPEGRRQNHFFLEARFRWSDLRSFILPSRFKKNLVALASEIAAALKACHFRKIRLHSPPGL